MEHIDENPDVVQKRVLDRIARKAIEAVNFDGDKFARESLHIQAQVSAVNKADLTSFYLQHPRSRVQHSRINFHCFEILYPLLEKNMFGFGKRRERGHESRAIYKAPDEGQWSEWMRHLSRTAVGEALSGQEANQAGHPPLPDTRQPSPSRSIQTMDYNPTMTLTGTLPEAPTLRDAW
jgi:hypothetical protein